MNANPKTARKTAHETAGSRNSASLNAISVPAPSTLVKTLALTYAVVVLGLAAHLFSDGTPGWAAQHPAVSDATRPTIDPEALTAGYRLESDTGAGSGYLELVPTGE